MQASASLLFTTRTPHKEDKVLRVFVQICNQQIKIITMAFKFVALFGLIAVASAGIIPIEHGHNLPVEHHHPQVYHAPAAPLHHVSPHHVAHEVYPDDPHPKYNFAYDVKDTVSGDSKSQVESRDGDVVQGEYSLDDADGFRRIVKYTADAVNGFNAVVHREPIHGHHVVAAAPAHYHHAAPAPAVLKAPLQYVAPTYASLPAHHEHHEHAAYATYEAPHESHDYYHHH